MKTDENHFPQKPSPIPHQNPPHNPPQRNPPQNPLKNPPQNPPQNPPRKNPPHNSLQSLIASLLRCLAGIVWLFFASLYHGHPWKGTTKLATQSATEAATKRATMGAAKLSGWPLPQAFFCIPPTQNRRCPDSGRLSGRLSGRPLLVAGVVSGESSVPGIPKPLYSKHNIALLILVI